MERIIANTFRNNNSQLPTNYKMICLSLVQANFILCLDRSKYLYLAMQSLKVCVHLWSIYPLLHHHLIKSRVTKSINRFYPNYLSICSIYHLLFLPFSVTFNRTMASFPSQDFGTTTWPLLPDGVTTLSVCVIVAIIRLTIFEWSCMYIAYIDSDTSKKLYTGYTIYLLCTSMF